MSKLSLKFFIKNTPKTTHFKRHVRDAIRSVFPAEDINGDTTEIPWTRIRADLIKHDGFDVSSDEWKIVATNFGSLNAGKKHYVSLLYWLYQPHDDKDDQLRFNAEAEELIPKVFGCSFEEFHQRSDLSAASEAAGKNDRREAPGSNIERSLGETSQPSVVHTPKIEKTIVSRVRLHGRLQKLALVGSVACLGMIGIYVASAKDTNRSAAEGTLTVDIRGISEGRGASVSTLAPSPFLTEDELVRFEFGVSGTTEMLAVGVYRMVSDIGDGELEEVFRVGPGATKSPNLVVRDTISGVMDKFGILVLGCVTRECDETIKAFDRAVLFSPSIPEVALGAEIDTSKNDQFFVPTSIISGG